MEELNVQGLVAEEPVEETGFEGFEEKETASAMEQGLSDMYDQQTGYFSEQGKALKTTTMLTTLATADMSKNISYQINEDRLETIRESLKIGKEKEIRYGIVTDRLASQMTGLNKVIGDLDFAASDPALIAGAEQAYQNVMQWDVERKSKTAIEEAALERIRVMAAADPVQARVLLNNLEYGSADKVAQDFQVKLSLLRQRAEEFDEEYQKSGWGRFLLNTALSLIPTNFNFARTGVVGTAGLGSLLAVGEAQRRESEEMWNNLYTMNLDEAADYLDRDGDLMKSVRDNATSVFDLVDDPGVASEIMDNLITVGDSDRVWNNVWGGAEIAMVVPWGKLASASRTLVAGGAAKDAVRNIDNALTIRDARGPEAMERATGVTERELADELSVSAIRGGEDYVPLSEPVEAHRLAAEQASREIFNSPEISSFRNIEELQNWVVGRVDEIRARIGSPIKDIHMVPVELSGGRNVYQMRFTVGKKDGFGYATEAAAKRGVTQMGFGNTAEISQSFVERVVPKFDSETKIANLSSTTTKDGGNSAYTFDLIAKNGEESRVSLSVDNGTGVGRVDIQGLNVNQLGPKEIRALGAQLADEIPQLKTLKGPRATGARVKAGVFEDAVVDITPLRGQTKIVRDMSGQYFAKITVDMPEAGWLVGKLEPDQQGFVGKMVGRWTRAAPRISDSQLHGMSVEAGAYLNRAQRHISEEVMGVFSRLDKKTREVVGALGKVESIRGRWLKPEEIDFMVDRQWGRAATEAEHKAMADLRLFNDMDWQLRNDHMYLDGIQKGKETVNFTTKWRQEIADQDVKIDYNMEKIPVERVYDASRGKHYVHGRNPLSIKDLTTMKNNGYVIMTFDEGFMLPEGIVVNKVLIKKTDVNIAPLKRNQLAYSEGGHRMYTAPVFVKQGRKGVQADTGTKYLSTPSTFRTAENIAEGKRWADKMNEARLAVKENRGITAQEIEDDIFQNQQSFPSGEEFLAGVADDTYQLDEAFEAVYDRELPSSYNTSGEDVARMFNEDELGINGYYRTTGRMYTSSKGEILRDTRGELAEVLDPYDTLARSLSQVTRQMGLYNYKLNALERFSNTYKQWLQADPNIRSASQMLTDAKVVDTAPLEIRNQIESQRAAILNVLRFETPADRMSRQAWQSTTANILGDGGNAGRKWAHDAVNWFRSKDPISGLRGMVFDAKLGMFNPGQLLIQSSTMLSATALSPKFGMQGMAGLYPMHRYILSRGSENYLDAIAKRGVWKTMGFRSADEFKDYSRHAYKHGFMEMNGSHIMINNHGPQSHFGSFGEKQTRAREQARVFFYTAETWNRLVAYRIAWGETTAKGLMPNHPDFNSSILKLADDYSFNMTSESAAFWQKGVLSIPTQFWAYNMRMLDAMTGNRFTTAQKLRLITMNFGIAGTAGIPGVQAISEYIKQTTGQAPDIDSINGVLDRGLIDYMNYQMTGNDILIGERVGTGGWATQTVKALMGKSEFGEQSFIDIAGGATLSVSVNTSKTLFNLAKYFAAESGSTEGVGEITKEGMLNVLKEVSTFSNASKAMLLHQYGMYKSNKGTVMVADLPPSHAAYAALSFRPAKADEIGYMLAWQKDKDDSLKEIAGKLRNWRQEALITGQYEKYWKKANTLIQLVPVQDRREIIRKTNNIDQESFHEYLEEKVSEEQTEEQALEALQ